MSISARSSYLVQSGVALAVVCALTVTSASQTRIVAPRNGYSVNDDVKLGREAAAEVVKELPLLNDETLEDYAEKIGRNLTAAIPAEFQHREFTYTFDVVNQKDINAFALPGGPMFLNRGMIEAANAEGEVAGVMAHEISHVALRHGTAQATAGQKFQIGSVLGQVLGAVVGGGLGSIIAQGSSFAFGTAFLKYSREYESQADILGAQILARAGYDPREMANMFKTIEKEGGSSGPQWLSSHPNPANRYEAINREAAMLRVEGKAASGEFDSIQARLRSMPPAYTAEQIAKGQAKSGTTTRTSNRAPVAVAAPASQQVLTSPFRFLRLRLPENWNEVSGDDTTVTYAPEGGYVESNGELQGFTHGMQVGIVARGSGNLQKDTDRLVQALAKNNPQIRQPSGYARETVGGNRTGLRTMLTNRSEITGLSESISLTTTLLKDGRLLYFAGVAPEGDARSYEDTFRRVRQTAQVSDR